ncbi:serine/threonine-protein kinase 3 isoform X5 [Rattus norvegicus]|uniref:serine/threonine-protein kinase 3 isoform X5 n=1 Tax=Rattus norvegicus TaxID=10116 RepID=UPI001917259D|nr:serine/threonine-protein kinase 3 isoform X3 [Rattus norvegicus]
MEQPPAPKSKLKKLSEDSLTKQPEEVFDVLEKLGEGSYGSVFKAIHKESGQVVAIKQVPVESDLQEIIKEISIMQQCDSPYVVKYYGSYFKNTDLWIVMEYCGAGSVSDIIRLRNKTAIFMIPTNPPPTFRKPELWSDDFTDFVKKCLVKSPEQRATATQLLQHPFIKNAKPVSILRELITEGMEIKAKRHEEQQRELEDEEENSDEDELDSHTMVKTSSEGVGTMRATSTMSEGAQTMIEHNSTMLESDLGTMVINSEDEEEEDGTMKRNATSPQVQRPSFMDYFDKQDFKNKSHENCDQSMREPCPMSNNVFPDNWRVPQDGDFDFIEDLRLAVKAKVMPKPPANGTELLTHSLPPLPSSNPKPHKRLKNLSLEELQMRLKALDPMMEREIEELHQRYSAKRQPILDAMDAKKRRQQNF